MARRGQAFLDRELTVVEAGERIAIGAAGSLLSQLGCRVISFEPVDSGDPGYSKWRTREQFVAGKQLISLDPEEASDRELAARIAGAADIVLTSTDIDRLRLAPQTSWQIHCDITAFGQSSPLSGNGYSDAQIQALTGMLDTTGVPEGPPVLVGGDATEFSTAIYAAAACVAALRVRRQCGEGGGGGQRIDMALFDCGFSTVSTFLPKFFAEPSAVIRRAGNRHPLTGPWNVFSARDGWVLICTANDAQWQSLCEIMNRPDLAAADEYATTAKRMARMAEIDVAIDAWAAKRTVAECVAAFEGTSVASGPIAPMDRYPREANLDFRNMIRRLPRAEDGEDVFLPASPIRAAVGEVEHPSDLPAPDAGRTAVLNWLWTRERISWVEEIPASSRAPILPLSGVRVLEIGHYTTAPLSARHLASLGAEVIKIEPPGGEGMRGWPPAQAGQSLFFTYTNADKRSLALDLNTPGGVQIFEKLILGSDVLVENLKPGALDKRGLGWDRLRALNPGLVYCAISGFGDHTIYSGRAAFDTVIQAMCGLMALNLTGGVPVKAGISSADLMGAELCVLNVLAALEARERTGRGDYFDLAMQDIAAWATQTTWNRSVEAIVKPTLRIASCQDGAVLVTHDGDSRVSDAEAAGLSRQQLTDCINAAGGVAVPVLTVNEAAAHPQTIARGLIFTTTDYRGIEWPMMSSPIRLSTPPPRTEQPMGELGRDTAAILDELGFDPNQTRFGKQPELIDRLVNPRRLAAGIPPGVLPLVHWTLVRSPA